MFAMFFIGLCVGCLTTAVGVLYILEYPRIEAIIEARSAKHRDGSMPFNVTDYTQQ